MKAAEIFEAELSAVPELAELAKDTMPVPADASGKPAVVAVVEEALTLVNSGSRVRMLKPDGTDFAPDGETIVKRAKSEAAAGLAGWAMKALRLKGVGRVDMATGEMAPGDARTISRFGGLAQQAAYRFVDAAAAQYLAEVRERLSERSQRLALAASMAPELRENVLAPVLRAIADLEAAREALTREDVKAALSVSIAGGEVLATRMILDDALDTLRTLSDQRDRDERSGGGLAGLIERFEAHGTGATPAPQPITQSAASRVAAVRDAEAREAAAVVEAARQDRVARALEIEEAAEARRRRVDAALRAGKVTGDDALAFEAEDDADQERSQQAIAAAEARRKALGLDDSSEAGEQDTAPATRRRRKVEG